ncbi:MAG: SpoIID/LytB domain-containing protein [Nitrospirales bacterium]|nr:SpoIID/LytB domain-containing protein [Nitrospirales bacterium]
MGNHHVSPLVLIVLAHFSLIFGCAHSPEVTREEIRVALAQQVAEVKILSPQSIRFKVFSEQRSHVESPLVVSPAGTGLMINGTQHDADHMIIYGHSREGLTLSVKQHSSSQDATNWRVSGHLHISNQNATLLIINKIDLETYVAGVVSSEINPSWHPEALKVQAVAARTYALHKKTMNGHRAYDVVAGTQDQVYHGWDGLNASVRNAVESTRRLIVTYDNAPIFAAYSSTAAGPTEDAFNVWSMDLPYLKGVECPFDEGSPRYRWQAHVPLKTIERQFRQEGFAVGTIVTIAPYTYSRAGRVNQIRILHSQGVLQVRGQDFRRIIGYGKVLSTQFTVQRIGKDLVLEGKGSGHAVGLCQWGMKEMAELGYSYQAILSYYYPKTILMDRRVVNLEPPMTP